MVHALKEDTTRVDWFGKTLMSRRGGSASGKDLERRREKVRRGKASKRFNQRKKLAKTG